jgi:hypothetical protein
VFHLGWKQGRDDPVGSAALETLRWAESARVLARIEPWSVRGRLIRFRRERGIDPGPINEVESHVKRLIVLRIGWDVGLRSGLLLALGQKMTS